MATGMSAYKNKKLEIITHTLGTVNIPLKIGIFNPLTTQTTMDSLYLDFTGAQEKKINIEKVRKGNSLPSRQNCRKSNVWRSVFLTTWHRILNADSTKTPSSSVTF